MKKHQSKSKEEIKREVLQYLEIPSQDLSQVDFKGTYSRKLKRLLDIDKDRLFRNHIEIKQ